MISIIIPTYNRANFLPRAIESVINQTYSEWELIIVDDGSTDNTKEVVKKYLTDRRIKYIKTKNKGAANARNVGALIATKEWITFLDSDDQAYPNWIKSWAEIIMNKPKIGLLSSGCDIYRDNIKVKSQFPTQSKLFKNLKFKITNGGSFAVKKEIFNKIKGYDIEFKANQHTELSYRLIPYLIKNNIKTISIDKSFIRINLHEGKRIRNDWNAVYQGTIKIIKKYKKLLTKDTNLLSNYYAVAANSAYRLNKKKSNYIHLQLNSIKYNPKKIISYLRLLKYLLIKNEK